MKLDICNDLTFEEQEHKYIVDGNILPSCTQIMTPLSKEIYGDIDPEILRTAAERGTTIHEGYELYIDFLVEDLPEEYMGYLAALKKFLKDYDVKAIATEQRIYHKMLRYAGTADLIAKIGDDTVLIDYKTTSQVVRKLTDVQLAAYKKALESQGIKIDYTAILHVDQGNYKFIRVDNDSEGYGIFLKLLAIHQYVQRAA